jgi:hypothetical protein
MSNDEFRLPGVLPDLAGLGELTLARGILRVVTAPVGVSWCIRASIEAAASVEWKLGGREICLGTGLFEKNRGDPGPSGGDWPAAAAKAPWPAVGKSAILGGEAPVLGFLLGNGSVILSGTACREDDRLALPRSTLVGLQKDAGAGG